MANRRCEFSFIWWRARKRNGSWSLLVRRRGWMVLAWWHAVTFFISRSLPFLSRRAFYILNGVSRSASFFLHDLTLVDPSPTAWTLGQLPEIIDALSCFFNTGSVVISLHLGCFTAKLGYCLVMGHSWGCHSRTIAMI